MFIVCLLLFLDGEKTSQFEIKLMDIDSEHLGIPVIYLFIIINV